MKRKLYKLLLLAVITVIFICISCKNDVQNSIPQLFVDNPATVTNCPVYEEVEDGFIIIIGQYSIIDTKSNVRYEGLEEIEYFDSLDDIPKLSKEEYDQLVEAGNAVTIENFPLGDPADPSSTETIIELYDNIEINVIDDSIFKLIMEI